jgi:hypothetical protein
VREVKVSNIHSKYYVIYLVHNLEWIRVLNSKAERTIRCLVMTLIIGRERSVDMVVSEGGHI